MLLATHFVQLKAFIIVMSMLEIISDSFLHKGREGPLMSA